MESLKDKTVTVTGGTGLVGSHLTAELLKKGCAVRLLVRSTSSKAALRATLQRMDAAQHYDRIEFRETPLNNPHELRRAIEGTDVLFHCAAQVSFDPDRAEEIVSANTEIATHVANCCLECGVELMVHVSSIATLGEPEADGETIDESCILSSLAGKLAYSVSKVYAENAVLRAMTQGLRALIVNPSVVIGEGEWDSGSPLLVAFAARRSLFYTPGVKGYVDVRDVARAMALLAEKPEAAGRRYIVSAENLSFRELFASIATAAGRRAPRIGIGAPALRLASKLDRGIGRITGRGHLLSDSVVANAVDCSRYSSARLLETIDFEFTPIRETLGRVTRQYLNDQSHEPHSRHHRSRR